MKTLKLFIILLSAPFFLGPVNILAQRSKSIHDGQIAESGNVIYQDTTGMPTPSKPDRNYRKPEKMPEDSSRMKEDNRRHPKPIPGDSTLFDRPDPIELRDSVR